MNFPNSILLTASLSLAFASETSADERYTRDARFAEHPGKLVAWGEASSPNNPVDLVGTLPKGRAAEGFIQVTGGDPFWAALHEDGTIYTYRCPKPDMRKDEGKIVKISAGFDQLAALDDQGHGYLWTQGNAKNFSPSADLVDLVDIEASNAQGYAVTADGRLIYWGRADPSNSTFSEKIAPHQGNIASLACVGFGGAAMSLDGAILRWGFMERILKSNSIKSCPYPSTGVSSHSSNASSIRKRTAHGRRSGAKVGPVISRRKECRSLRMHSLTLTSGTDDGRRTVMGNSPPWRDSRNSSRKPASPPSSLSGTTASIAPPKSAPSDSSRSSLPGWMQ